MSKFEDIFRKAVEGYEAPFNPSAWDAISNELDGSSSFEESIKESVENFEAPFNAAAWTAIADQLDSTPSFEESIKESVENFEAPYDAAAWTAVANELDTAQFTENIKDAVQDYAPVGVGAAAAWTAVSSELDNIAVEEGIKETVSNYEAPYNPSAWDAISSKLGPTYTGLKWIAGSAALIAAIVGGYYFSNNEPVVSEGPFVEEQIAENDIQPTNGSDLTVPNGGINDKSSGDIVHHAIEGEEGNNDIIEIEEGDVVVDYTPGDSDGGNDNTNNSDNTSGNNEGDNASNNQDAASQGTTTNDTEAKEYTADFTMDKIEVCAGESVVLQATNVGPECICVWELGNGMERRGQLVEIDLPEEGQMNITLNLLNKAGTKLLATETKEVSVNPIPAADFTYIKEFGSIPTMQFVNKDLEDANISWNIDGKVIKNVDEFQHTFRTKGDHIVQMVAANDYGCSTTIEKTIEIENDYNLLAPAGFTPDDDNRNDTWIPVALTVLDTDFKLTIQDRSGNLVYHTTDANQPWDGRYTIDNKLAPMGAYVWQVQLTNANGEVEFYQGTVSLVK